MSAPSRFSDEQSTKLGFAENLCDQWLLKYVGFTLITPSPEHARLSCENDRLNYPNGVRLWGKAAREL
jgi:hypothetical protein